LWWQFKVYGAQFAARSTNEQPEYPVLLVKDQACVRKPPKKGLSKRQLPKAKENSQINVN